MQLAAKADLTRLEKLEQQVDGALNEISSVRSKQVRATPFTCGEGVSNRALFCIQW